MNLKVSNADDLTIEEKNNINISNTIDVEQIAGLSSNYKTLFIVIYSLIFMLSLAGNSVILVILWRRKRMRTVNNFFLANIAVSNLIYTLFAPFPFIIELQNVNSAWIFLDFMCPIIPFLNTVAINLNTITMIVSSIDRLIAIICPFRSKLTKKECSYIIIFIWFISVLFSLPWTILVEVQEKMSFLDELEQESIDYEPTSSDDSIKLCVPLQKYEHIISIYFVILCVIQYFLPLIVLCLTFSVITYYINVVNAKSIKNDANKSNYNLRKRNEKRVNFSFTF